MSNGLKINTGSIAGHTRMVEEIQQALNSAEGPTPMPMFSMVQVDGEQWDLYVSHTGLTLDELERVVWIAQASREFNPWDDDQREMCHEFITYYTNAPRRYDYPQHIPRGIDRVTWDFRVVSVHRDTSTFQQGRWASGLYWFTTDHTKAAKLAAIAPYSEPLT